MDAQNSSPCPQPAQLAAAVAPAIETQTYSVKETAKVTGVSEATVRRWYMSGVLKPLDNLRHKRFSNECTRFPAAGGAKCK
jgi:transposase